MEKWIVHKKLTNKFKKSHRAARPTFLLKYLLLCPKTCIITLPITELTTEPEIEPAAKQYMFARHPEYYTQGFVGIINEYYNESDYDSDGLVPVQFVIATSPCRCGNSSKKNAPCLYSGHI